MALKKLPNGGGTNADEKFKQPDMTAGEMQEFVKGKMKEMGFPGFFAGFFTKGIPKWKRWNPQTDTV